MLRVTHGTNDLLHAEDGTAFLDLVCSTGAVFLGHANARVNRHVTAQLDRVSASWTSAMEIQDTCKAVVDARAGGGLSLHSLYSSGTEAADVAVRMAIHRTKRTAVVGFRHNHHGKSLAVQNLTGIDADLPALDSFHPLPFLPDCTEAEALDRFEQVLTSVHPAAVFVEPMQGRGGGHEASPAFYGELQRRCAEREVLVICDEIFCGGHRTGPFLHHRRLGIEPDLVLVGKAIANGFPAAGVMLAGGWDLHPKDFRFSSTFSNNPLACAAVVGTLEEMERIDVEPAVAAIEATLGGIDVDPARLRLRGAACFVDLPTESAAAAVQDHLFRERVLVLRRGCTVGLWPPATIEPAHLDRVVQVVDDALVPFR